MAVLWPPSPPQDEAPVEYAVSNEISQNMEISSAGFVVVTEPGRVRVHRVKIAYGSNIRFPWCTESEVTKTLRRMGHEVVSIQEDEGTSEQLMVAARTSDMLLWPRTWNRLVKHEHLAELRALGIPTVALHECTP